MVQTEIKHRIRVNPDTMRVQVNDGPGRQLSPQVFEVFSKLVDAKNGLPFQDFGQIAVEAGYTTKRPSKKAVEELRRNLNHPQTPQSLLKTTGTQYFDRYILDAAIETGDFPIETKAVPIFSRNSTREKTTKKEQDKEQDLERAKKVFLGMTKLNRNNPRFTYYNILRMLWQEGLLEIDVETSDHESTIKIPNAAELKNLVLLGYATMTQESEIDELASGWDEKERLEWEHVQKTVRYTYDGRAASYKNTLSRRITFAAGQFRNEQKVNNGGIQVKSEKVAMEVFPL